jgi:hypothetical protein
MMRCGRRQIEITEGKIAMKNKVEDMKDKGMVGKETRRNVNVKER